MVISVVCMLCCFGVINNNNNNNNNIGRSFSVLLSDGHVQGDPVKLDIDSISRLQFTQNRRCDTVFAASCTTG